MLIAAVNSPFCVQIKPQGALVVGNYFDIDVIVNANIVEQSKNKLNLKEIVVDFLISTPAVPPEYNLHIGAQYEEERYPMLIKSTMDFLFFSAMKLPVLPVLDSEKSIVNVSLLTQSRKNYFNTRIPFECCLTYKEPLR